MELIISVISLNISNQFDGDNLMKKIRLRLKCFFI